MFTIKSIVAPYPLDKAETRAEGVKKLLLLRLRRPETVFTLWEETETAARLVTPAELAGECDRLIEEATEIIAAVHFNRIATNGQRADSIRTQIKARQEADMAGADVVAAEAPHRLAGSIIHAEGRGFYYGPAKDGAPIWGSSKFHAAKFAVGAIMPERVMEEAPNAVWQRAHV